MIRIPQFHRYIARQLGLATIIIALSLASIVWLLQALRFVDYIVNRGVSIGTFLHLTTLMLPSLMVTIMPLALMAATVFVYARLMQDSELVVLFSVGLSRVQVAQPLLGVGLVLSAALYGLTMQVVPRVYTDFKDMQIFLRDNYAALLLQEEVFNSPVDGLTVFVRSRSEDGLLKGILVHDGRNAKRPVTMMAQQAMLMQTPSGPRFLLLQGSRQELDEGKMSVLNFDRYPLDLNFYSDRTTRPRKADEMDLNELLQGDTPEGNASESYGERMAEFFRRISWPLLTLAMSMLALGSLLRGEFNRRNHGRRLGVAAGVALIPLVTALMLENTVSNAPALGVLMVLNPAVAFGFGMMLLSNRVMRYGARFAAWVRTQGGAA